MLLQTFWNTYKQQKDQNEYLHFEFDHSGVKSTALFEAFDENVVSEHARTRTHTLTHSVTLALALDAGAHPQQNVFTGTGW